MKFLNAFHAVMGLALASLMRKDFVTFVGNR
jgi:hypothetical protein